MDEKEIEMIAEEELEKAQKADGEAEAEKAEAEGAAEIEAKELETYKEMSPFRLVLRRFFRSKLSIVGLVMIVFLFAFSFLGPVIYTRWGETEPDRRPITVKDEIVISYEDGQGNKIEATQIIFINKETRAYQGISLDHLLGTDDQGLDIFVRLMYGGRISLAIGLLSTLISTVIAVLFGAVSGCAPAWLDALLMRLTEIFLSVPNLLLVIFLLAAAGKSNVITISAVIGMTSWTSIAKVVRTEVRQIRNSEYVIASRCMGGSFFYILWHHLAPNFFSSIMFMVVMNIRSAIVAESTLSFMGIGLPLEVISWGSMLSLSEKALMTKAWWIILIPGVFLIVTLLSFTSIGNYLRKQANRKQRNL